MYPTNGRFSKKLLSIQKINLIILYVPLSPIVPLSADWLYLRLIFGDFVCMPAAQQPVAKNEHKWIGGVGITREVRRCQRNPIAARATQ
jgi:hypothetical protein